MERIEASTDPPNEPSVRVMERLGMTHLETRTLDGLPTAFFALEREVWHRTRD